MHQRSKWNEGEIKWTNSAVIVLEYEETLAARYLHIWTYAWSGITTVVRHSTARHKLHNRFLGAGLQGLVVAARRGSWSSACWVWSSWLQSRHFSCRRSRLYKSLSSDSNSMMMIANNDHHRWLDLMIPSSPHVIFAMHEWIRMPICDQLEKLRIVGKVGWMGSASFSVKTEPCGFPSSGGR